jgi:hypothetical protein
MIQGGSSNLTPLLDDQRGGHQADPPPAGLDPHLQRHAHGGADFTGKTTTWKL